MRLLLDIRLLFEKNKKLCTKNILLQKKNNKVFLLYKLKSGILDGYAIKDIVAYINGVTKKYGTSKIPIVLDLGNVDIADKLSYIFLECICEYLVSICRRSVTIWCVPRLSIGTEGIESSPLLLLNGRGKVNVLKYPDKFRFDIFNRHYRRIIDAKEMETTSILSELMQELDYFLKFFDVDVQSRKDISEVIVELIGNAGEHSTSNCLIDLDVSEEYHKNEGDNGYYGINLAVVNFSNTLLGDGIKNKIKDKTRKLNDKHEIIKKTYDKHKQEFSKTYCEQDFFNIASFQHKITGRLDNSATGGTGLTLLIRSLESRSDAHKCYVLSGERVLWFHKDCLEYNGDWIGFNKSHDFLNLTPDAESLSFCPIYIPGTAYNLNFVLKKEE